MARIGNPQRRQKHWVKEWREFRGLSQDELAARVGATKTPIHNIETLKAGYTQDGLEAIADALGVSVLILLSRPPNESDRLPPPSSEPPRRPRRT